MDTLYYYLLAQKLDLDLGLTEVTEEEEATGGKK